MLNVLPLILGGTAGLMSRYYLSNYINSVSAPNFKLGTIVVNLIGSFIIGGIYAFIENRPIDTKVKDMLTSGFLGCFTTFSTFSLETMQYLSNSEYFKAIAYISISNVLGIALAFTGYFLVKQIIKF